MPIKSQKYLVATSLIFSSLVVAENGQCPYPERYIEIDRAYHQCHNRQVRKDASCDLFIKNVTTLFPKYICKRSFDTQPVPAIWLFDAASEDYIRLIYDLASKNSPTFKGHLFSIESTKAKEIFLSQEFRNVLDGHLAEEYLPLIESMKNTP